MTDKEIIRALECCISAESCCECGYTKMCDGTTTQQFALDLINRQQSAIDVYMRENDRLKTAYIQVSMDRDEAKAEIEWKTTYMHSLQVSMEEIKPQIRAEAIKEVEAKIHEKLHQAEMHGNFEPVVTREMFDSVVKEVVGEGK